MNKCTSVNDPSSVSIIQKKLFKTASPERSGKMKQDPFGDLTDWGPVLDILKDLADNGALSTCQPGLIRILRYKGNWRLREEVLKRIGEIQTPSIELVHQLITILDDDNIYYDARIIAGNALVQLLKNVQGSKDGDIYNRAQKVIDKLKSTPQPPFFDTVLNRLYSELAVPRMLEKIIPSALY